MKTFKHLLLIIVLVQGINLYGQESVPLGINYQAVARDNFGKELVNKNIDVRFSIIMGNPLGTLVYQELHSKVKTSKYGVFSIIIGAGVPTGGLFGELSQINWSQAYHYLKVEVKFDIDFIDMNTMQFMAVPYALYAQKSLEPGPKGEKGDQGDPASDDQTLSFNGNNLSISGGNTVNLSTLNIPHQLSVMGDTLTLLGGNKVTMPNHLQALQLDDNNILRIDKNPSSPAINLTKFLDDKQQLTYSSTDNKISISGGNTIDLTPMKQDLTLVGNNLSITNPMSTVPVNLSKYQQTLSLSGANILSISDGNNVDLSALMNDADANPTNEIQDLIYNPATMELSLLNSSAPAINLSGLKNDADSSPTNEIQSLSYNQSTNTLNISGSGGVVLGTMIAFRAKKTISTSAPMPLSNVDFISDEVEYNDGGGLNVGTGEFTAEYTGLYTFDVKYVAPSVGNSRDLMLFKNGNLYEYLESNISANTSLFRNITIKLVASDKIKVVINTGTGTDIGTGVFSGYRLH